jgi:hypothetical protein
LIALTRAPGRIVSVELFAIVILPLMKNSLQPSAGPGIVRFDVKRPVRAWAESAHVVGAGAAGAELEQKVLLAARPTGLAERAAARQEAAQDDLVTALDACPTVARRRSSWPSMRG